MKLLLMADYSVGQEIFQYLFKNYFDDIALVITTTENEIFHSANSFGIPVLVYDSAEQIVAFLDKSKLRIDLGILAWWPKIIKKPLLGKPVDGFINTHPSLLPYNRGKHYNFWTLVEQVPFGVTLHFVDEGIDSGDIIAQKVIPYNWEDNGFSLYQKAQIAMVNLFRDVYPKIRIIDITPTKQDSLKASFHMAKEIEQASFINLDNNYKVRDLLNLLRARTFPGHPACWFRDGDVEYEVRIEIKRKQ